MIQAANGNYSISILCIILGIDDFPVLLETNRQGICHQVVNEPGIPLRKPEVWKNWV